VNQLDRRDLDREVLPQVGEAELLEVVELEQVSETEGRLWRDRAGE
jgi:hypothetical protein